MHPKDADGMANSVDPDQTASSEAVWSWSALFAETYLSQYIEFVRYLNTELQIRGGSQDNLKMIFLISQWKHMLWPLIRTVSARRL